MLLLTLRGTPTIYYGDEIGMKDVPIPFESLRDPQGLNMPDKNLSRDPARTPMQWDATANAGFSSVKPWLPVERNFLERNVAIQRDDPSSLLHLYHRLIQLRKAEESLSLGEYIPVFADNQMIAYVRYMEGCDAFLVLLNFTHRPCYLKQSNSNFSGTVILSASGDQEGNHVTDTITLDGDEALIIRLDEYPLV